MRRNIVSSITFTNLVLGLKRVVTLFSEFFVLLFSHSMARQVVQNTAHVTLVATGKNIARQVAERLLAATLLATMQWIFSGIGWSDVSPATCVARVSGINQWKCSFDVMWSSKRRQVTKTLPCVTPVEQLVAKSENFHCRSKFAIKHQILITSPRIQSERNGFVKINHRLLFLTLLKNDLECSSVYVNIFSKPQKKVWWTFFSAFY